MPILIFIFITILLFVIYLLSSQEERKARSKREPRGKLEEYCPDGRDRRRCQRFSTMLDVKYKILKSSNKANSLTSTKDISASGIGILVYEIIPKDTLMEIEIAIPTQKEPLKMRGKVAWCEGREGAERLDKNGRRVFLVGIEFLVTEKDQKAKLVDYINTYLVSKT